MYGNTSCPSRRQTVIVDLARSLDEPQDSANLQIAVLSFSNAIINYKAGEVRPVAVSWAQRGITSGVLKKELCIQIS